MRWGARWFRLHFQVGRWMVQGVGSLEYSPPIIPVFMKILDKLDHSTDETITLWISSRCPLLGENWWKHLMVALFVTLSSNYCIKQCAIR